MVGNAPVHKEEMNERGGSVQANDLDQGCQT